MAVRTPTKEAIPYGLKSREVNGVRGKATLQLTLHADGLPHTKALLIFKGQYEGAKRRNGMLPFWYSSHL